MDSDQSPWRDISGFNAGYIAELYDRYRTDPHSVDNAAHTFFKQWAPPVDPALKPNFHGLDDMGQSLVPAKHARH